jgi:hypothetical protein
MSSVISVVKSAVLSLAEIRKMVKKMFKASAKFLPQFRKVKL